MFPNIVICENPAGDKQIGFKLIPPKTLETQLISKTINYETNEFPSLPVVLPNEILSINSDLSRNNQINLNQVNQVIINIDLNRERESNRSNFSLDCCLDNFCKYICCCICNLCDIQQSEKVILKLFMLVILILCLYVTLQEILN